MYVWMVWYVWYGMYVCTYMADFPGGGRDHTRDNTKIPKYHLQEASGQWRSYGDWPSEAGKLGELVKGGWSGP